MMSPGLPERVDSGRRPGGFVMTDEAVAYCRFKQGDRVLDVGCGSGASVQYLRKRYEIEAFGIDKNPELIKNDRYLVYAFGHKIPYLESSMHGVLMECSLSKMDDPEAVLQECSRVLRPGGFLVVSDMYARGKAARFEGCLGRIELRETLLAMLAGNGFWVEWFKDYSDLLHQYWGQLVFEKGVGDFYKECRTDAQTLQSVQCGYCLIVARKAEPI